MHQKKSKLLLSLLCAAAVLTTGISFQSKGDSETMAPQPVRVYGTVGSAQKNRISIARQDNNFSGQEFIITISEETKVLDAVTGFPVAPDTIKAGEMIYAYIGPAMTMSLPPMSNGEMILCNIPADFKVPAYITVDTLNVNGDNVSGTIVSTDGDTYTVPSDCQILPYLTRNIEVLQNLTKGRKCLVWTESNSNAAESNIADSNTAGSNTAYKIVAFARSAADSVSDSVSDSSSEPNGPGGTVRKFGWAEVDGSWFYYGHGGLHKGWLQENGDWYYLDPETGRMQTGFITIDEKTYYLNEDGRMLTAPRTFTPDENGVLH